MHFRTLLLASAALLLRSTLAAPQPADAVVDQNAQPETEPLEKRAGDTKYFHEPDGMGHYDSRYFKGDSMTTEERIESLHHLVRSYLLTFREKNIETWIAHGTLLGWWWNGKIMPWDTDLDTQVSGATLTWLGENMNRTLNNYTAVAPDGSQIQREYLLDVNPNHVQRVFGDGMNVIDARWIDVRNGLFIDITGLSETDPSKNPGVWSCKNYHRYRTKDLYPLRETMFEGVPALVPYSFDQILTAEYSHNALTQTLFEGHRWLPEQKEWVLDVKQHKRDADSKPHIPRSLQPDSPTKSGLGNLLRVL